VAAVTTEPGVETTLMIVSSLVAVGGIAIAAFFFLTRRSAARAVADRFDTLHRVLEHKYYVDEIYDETVVQPVLITSERVLWKGLDVHIIDGAVNGVAETVSGGADVLRRLQSGSVRTYAVSLFLGVVLILGYYVWR
jgi:NADH-quinone oxidoreductase subunit L